MNKENKLILGTLAGVDLVLSLEHHGEYKGTLNKQLEQKDKEIERYKNIINELEKYLFSQLQEYGGGGTAQECYDKLKELKEGDK